MAYAGKSSWSFGIIVAGGFAGALCVASPILAQDAQTPQQGAAAPKAKTQKSGATRKPPGGVSKPAAAAASQKQRPPAKAPGQQAPKTTPAPPAQPRLAPLPPVDPSTPPPLLPRASRERMRACAEEWDKMKRATTSALPMWREFAIGCLTRRG
jgi:hypothetical protein